MHMSLCTCPAGNSDNVGCRASTQGLRLRQACIALHLRKMVAVACAASHGFQALRARDARAGDADHGMHVQDMVTMLQTNVAAVMEFTHAFAPPMVQRNRGHIINISSVAGHEAYGGAGVDAVLRVHQVLGIAVGQLPH